MNPYIKRLRKHARLSAFNNRLLSRTLALMQYSKFAKGKSIPGNGLKSAINTFVPEDKRADKAYIAHLVKEMLYCRYYNQIDNKEFFMYEFERLSERERKQYVGAFELKRYYRAMNAYGRPDVIDSKEKTYEFYKEFFHRDCLYYHDHNQGEEFLQFLQKHRVCLLKPLRQYGGKGIRRLEITDEKSAESIYSANKKYLPFLLEELIEQDPGMAIFHPQSVNTVRYNTFFHNDKLYRLQAVLRIGRGNTFLDNASSGGIYSLIDTDMGILKGPARSFAGELYEFHPDTGVYFQGSLIPRWNELNELLEKIVRVIPGQKQVGWDFALSKDGWVLVEANTSPALQSFDLTHGLRKLVVETFGQVVPVAKF